MPKIEVEVTAEQAALYEKGRTIAVRKPDTDKLYVVVSRRPGGLIYEARGPLSNAEWRVLRPADGYNNVFPEYDGDRRFDFTRDIKDGAYTAVELNAKGA